MRMSWFEKFVINSRLYGLWRVWSMQNLLKEVKDTKGLVLEIGCGKGTTTLQLAKNIPSAKIIGTDFDSNQIAIAKKMPENKRIEFMQADASNLKFKSNTFSALFSFLTYHHIKNWRKALRESYRVLKPNGNIYIEDLALYPFPRLKHWFFPVPGIFSKEEFFAELEKVGFRVIKSKRNYKFLVHACKP